MFRHTTFLAFVLLVSSITISFATRPILAVESPLDAASLVKRGNEAFESKNFERAIAEYGEALKLDPRNDQLYVKRGRAWAEKEDRHRAIVDLNSAVEIAPDSAEAR